MALLACLATIFTSWSFAMTDRRDLPPIRMQPQQARALCERYQSAAQQECETSSITSRHKHLSCHTTAQRKGQTCQRAMQHAAKRLNVDGCSLRAQQQVILCEMEWCHYTRRLSSLPAPVEQCRQECDRVRQVLRQCIDKQTDKSLHAFGLEQLPSSTTAIDGS